MARPCPEPRRVQPDADRPGAAALVAICGVWLACSLGLSGCAAIEDLGYQTNPNSTSILDLWRRPPPDQAVAWALDIHNADNRYRGVTLLSDAPFAGDDLYLQLFIESADDSDSAVRTAAIRGLARHGRPEHAPIIAEALTDDSVLVRLEAARAAQRIHNPAIVSSLFARLDPEAEREHDVRAAAAHALGQYPQPRVLDQLVAALRDPSLTVNRHAAEALTILTGEDLGLDPIAWLEFVRDTREPFSNAARYRYPTFERGMRLVEYIPLYPRPPLDPPAEPIGLPKIER
ncbi:MAG: HEAT repeat domain-containing protein [Planctomycetota bacterium]